ncbi:protein ripply2 [Misgurnus anguillicaudatus]|uniref:protein ripply2 n=1 Tax=Misgurnus anguillicaudatus TaxID=75329 RepID=UPI002434B85F|nr:protein ripply2 [Misgurnus anguillicaudatus]XP_055046650.1 protein ripply2 [Misgurnus anguillicaudatus]
MERIAFTNGLNSATNSQDATQPWRPWTRRARHERKAATYSPYKKPALTGADDQHCTIMTHPVKLFWPKSQCFDYLYRDAEILLQNYPVQATICLYEDSDSDDENDSDEEDEKELN